MFTHKQNGINPVVSQSKIAFNRYMSLYNNQTYRAIRAAIEAEYIFDSPYEPDDHPVTDFMNLVTDAAMSRCGYFAYPGTEEKIAETIKRWEKLRIVTGSHTSAIETAVKAHLDQFSTPQLATEELHNGD